VGRAIVFDNLIHTGDIPVTIAVLIDPASNSGLWPGGSDPGRSRQYDTPNDQYGKFLVSEFLPSEIFFPDALRWLWRGYHTPP
jgi:enterochelin esterase family protein